MPDAHLTPEVLDRLEELRAKGTPGEWRKWNDGHVGSPSAHLGGIVKATPGSDPEQRLPDAGLIVAAVNAVGPLIQALHNARRERDLALQTMTGLAAEVEHLRGEGRESDAIRKIIATRRQAIAERDQLRATVERVRGIATPDDKTGRALLHILEGQP